MKKFREKLLMGKSRDIVTVSRFLDLYRKVF